MRDGYRVLTAYDGASGIQLLKDHPEVALLFTDVVLPRGMNGRQLADEALQLHPQLPVLFATGYTSNAIIHQGRLDPDVELLTKPFTADALVRKIRQLFGEAPAASSSERQAALRAHLRLERCSSRTLPLGQLDRLLQHLKISYVIGKQKDKLCIQLGCPFSG
jgi:CheY-like chemotaxis protein